MMRYFIRETSAASVYGAAKQTHIVLIKKAVKTIATTK